MPVGLGLAALIWMLPQPAVAAPAVVDADPTIFVIRDQDTTVYLFGTFHVLSPNLKWFDGPVEEAFSQSDELIVETMPTQGTAKSARGLPGPAARITPAASFLAATQDAVRAGQSRGMAISNGADMVLLRAAAESGKAVESLETLDSQFAMMASIPSERALPAPCATRRCARPADLSSAMAELQSAWASGDHQVFSEMLSEMEVNAPSAYRILFVERNARWSNWVAARMRQPGTAFVAIGAAHLAGSDSLLVRLAQRGLISRRLR